MQGDKKCRCGMEGEKWIRGDDILDSVCPSIGVLGWALATLTGQDVLLGNAR